MVVGTCTFHHQKHVILPTENTPLWKMDVDEGGG